MRKNLQILVKNKNNLKFAAFLNLYQEIQLIQKSRPPPILNFSDKMFTTHYKLQ